MDLSLCAWHHLPRVLSHLLHCASGRGYWLLDHVSTPNTHKVGSKKIKKSQIFLSLEAWRVAIATTDCKSVPLLRFPPFAIEIEASKPCLEIFDHTLTWQKWVWSSLSSDCFSPLPFSAAIISSLCTVSKCQGSSCSCSVLCRTLVTLWVTMCHCVFTRRVPVVIIPISFPSCASQILESETGKRHPSTIAACPLTIVWPHHAINNVVLGLHWICTPPYKCVCKYAQTV